MLLAACTLAVPGLAMAQDAKKALASRLAQIQVKLEGPSLAEQLTSSAAQPLLATWSQRLDESVPPARQPEVREKLSAELNKFGESTHKAVTTQLGKAAEAALVPIYMEKLSEDEMKAIIAFLESPANTKFQALGNDSGNAWAQKVVEATRASVEAGAKAFDAAANRIVAAPPAAAPAAGAGTGSKK